MRTQNNLRISYTTFKKLRLQNVLPVSCVSHQTCLCKQHQNTALLLDAAKEFVADFTTVPDNERKADGIPISRKVYHIQHLGETYSKHRSIREEGPDMKKVKLVAKSLMKSELIYEFIHETD